MKSAKDCINIEEIRTEIDDIDNQILESFSKRMEYVHEIVKFKSDENGIVARDRQDQVFQQIREKAKHFDLDPDLYEQIYRTLINWNVQKEMELFKSNQETK